ncbi:MAG TPA: hypothetical protein VFU89_08220 [Rhabdochlamydiaceae bacterium]|nr:hypothetical protein [Rhabdochlamydiaceae bacterium]
MKITIAERLRPFSHLPGASCVIPWSSYKLQAFPAMLIFENLRTFEKHEVPLVPLGWKGPVKEFTVELDLEKGVVWVYGKTVDGHRRLCIEMQEDGIAIDKRVVVSAARLVTHPIERLSLGMSKKLDWELVARRQEMAEILPVWFRLGQMVPSGGTVKVGTASLLQECEKLDVTETYLKLFLTGFEGILCPRLSDTSYQGIVPEGKFSESPLILLTEGMKYIRALFFKETDQSWEFLPCLAPEFHAGRVVELTTKAGDKIDFEWSKKSLQKVVIHAESSREIFLSIPKPFNFCRLRTSPGDKGDRGEKGSRHFFEKSLRLLSGQKLFLDRFEK